MSVIAGVAETTVVMASDIEAVAWRQWKQMRWRAMVTETEIAAVET